MLSRWTDTQSSLEHVLESIERYQQEEVDPITKAPLGANVDKVFTQNRTTTINGKRITYNLINLTLEHVNSAEANNQLLAARIKNISYSILVYSDGEHTQYIVDKAYGSALKTVLRKINHYSDKGEIVENSVPISGDLFIWFVYMIREHSNEYLDDSNLLQLSSITGFRGMTQDHSTLSAKGEKVLNLLSALSFILENKSLSYVGLELYYGDEDEPDRFVIGMNVNGTIDVKPEQYVGQYEDHTPDERECILKLKAFNEIVPQLVSAYMDATQENTDTTWKKKKNDFYSSLGVDIQNELQTYIDLDAEN